MTLGEQLTGQGPPLNSPTGAAPPPLGPRIGRGPGYLWPHLAWRRAPPRPVAPPPPIPDWSPPRPSLSFGQWEGARAGSRKRGGRGVPQAAVAAHHASPRAKPVCRAPPPAAATPAAAAAARTPAVERAAGGGRRPGAGHGRAAAPRRARDAGL